MSKVFLLLVCVWFGMRRFSTAFRIYACLLAVLIVQAGRKDLFGLAPIDYQDSVTSRMALLRWGLLALTAGIGFVLRYAPQRHSDAAKRLGAGALAFVILCAASSSYGLVPLGCLMRAASLLLLIAALAWTIYPAMRDSGQCNRLIAVHELAALGVVAFNFYLLLQGRGFVVVESKHIVRFGGLLDNPIQMSTFVVLTLPCCLFMARARGWLSWHGAVFVGLIVSLVPTHARAGMMAAAIGLAVFAYIVADTAGRQRWASISLLLSPLLAFVPWARELVRGEGGTFWEILYTARLALWSDLFKHFKTSPWLGHGFGCSHLFSRLVVADPEYADMHAHNSYFEVFGDLGMVGVALMTMLLVGLVRHGRRSLQAGDPRTREMHAAIFATVVSGLVDAASDSWLFSVGNNSSVMFWVMATAMVARADGVLELEAAQRTRHNLPHNARWRRPLVVPARTGS